MMSSGMLSPIISRLFERVLLHKLRRLRKMGNQIPDYPIEVMSRDSIDPFHKITDIEVASISRLGPDFNLNLA